MTAASRRRLPVVATLVVVLAVAVMVALGIWQLGRAQWKADLIESYSGAQGISSQVPWPRTPQATEAALYRRSAFTCERVLETRATAGRSATGASGWAHMARCALASDDGGGGEAEVALGWTRAPQGPAWTGGPVTGFVAAAGEGARLVASPPLAGLAQLAPPDPGDLPNNHLAYAGQWFFFAFTALLIYGLALRRRARDAGAQSDLSREPLIASPDR